MADTQFAQTLRKVIPISTSLRLVATCLPPTDINWSLAELYASNNVESSPELSTRLLQVLKQHGAGQKVYAPNVGKMSGLVVSREALTTHIPLGDGYTLICEKNVPADGVPLSRDGSESFIFGGGGCILLVAVSKTKILPAHASFQSLVDLKAIQEGRPPRHPEGIIASMAAYFRNEGIPPSEVRLYTFFSVSPKMFMFPLNDPEHVHFENNKKVYDDLIVRRGLPARVMSKKGHIDNAALVAVLAKRHGFGSCEDYCVLPDEGVFGTSRHPDPALKMMRNLVMLTVACG